MDIQDIWEKALRNTEIIRPRVQPLLTFSTTNLPYIFLSESLVNIGDTVVRRSEILVERPTIILPTNLPQFEGFDFEEKLHFNQDTLINFLFVRGIKFPSLKYNNKTYLLDVYEGNLKKAIKYYSDKLQREEDVHTGLIVGPEDCWQFSVLFFICSQVIKSSEGDIKKILEGFKKKGRSD